MPYANATRTTITSSSQRCAEPVAELSGFVASNTKSVSKAYTFNNPRQLKWKQDQISLETNDTSGSGALELLRNVLDTVALQETPTNGEEEDDKSTSVVEDDLATFAGPSLQEQRIRLFELLQEQECPQAESIISINRLLDNRAQLRLLDPVSASDYTPPQPAFDQQEGEEEEEEDVGLVMPISVGKQIDGNDEEGCTGNMSTSLESEESTSSTLVNEEANAISASAIIESPGNNIDSLKRNIKAGLIEMWASNGFWRGVSSRAWNGSRYKKSSSTLGDDETNDSKGELAEDAEALKDLPPAIEDVMGICWPLDNPFKYEDVRSCWGRFYAELGDVRVPSRFRVPRHSLIKLATEQLMMQNDKIVCPLKNRLQEANPRRQQFEDYVREVGTLPPPPSSSSSAAAGNRRSPLQKQIRL